MFSRIARSSTANRRIIKKCIPFLVGLTSLLMRTSTYHLWPFGQRLKGLLQCTAILQQLGWSHKICFNENVQPFCTPLRWPHKTGSTNKVNVYVPRRVWGSWWRDRSGCVPRWGRHARRSSPSPPIGGTYPSPPASRCPAGFGCYIYLQKWKKMVL